MADRGTLLITGAAGRIGTAVQPGLAALGWRLRLTDVEAPEEVVDPDAWLIGSLDDDDVAARAVDGVTAVLHLAGIPGEDSWQQINSTNIDDTHRLLETVASGPRCPVVLASSIHAAGLLSATELRGRVDVVAPDSLYGVSKAAMEALGTVYAARHGWAITSIRICTFTEEPDEGRTLGTFFSVPDAVRAFDAAALRDDPGHRQFWGVSANEPRWFDLTPGEAVGYRPQDDAVALHTARTGSRPDAPDPDQPLGGAFLGPDTALGRST